jgi:hypothetical protein
MFVAVMAQPLLAGVLAFLLFPLLLLDRSGRTLAGGFPADVSDAAMSVAIAVGMLAFVVTLAGALPAAVWLTRRRHVSLREAALYGLLFGNLPIIFGTALAGAYGIEGFLRGVAFASVLGVAGAAVFWLIAIRPKQIGYTPPHGIHLGPDSARTD